MTCAKADPANSSAAGAASKTKRFIGVFLVE